MRKMGFLPQELITNVRKIIERTRKILEANKVCFLVLTKSQNNFSLDMIFNGLKIDPDIVLQIVKIYVISSL